jgi:hypothetical protein
MFSHNSRGRGLRSPRGEPYSGPLAMRAVLGVAVRCSVVGWLIVGCAHAKNSRPAAPPAQSRLVINPVATTSPAGSKPQPFVPAPLTPAEIAQRARPSVVLVRAGEASSGTGFVVGPDLVATALHVVAGAETVTLRQANGRVTNVVQVEAFDRLYDVAILRTAEGDLDLPALPLGDSTKLAQGESIVAVGNPMGLEATISTGVVSAIRTTESGLTFVQVTAPISPGSSGGPLLNDRGEVVAVVEMYLAQGQALNFGSPSTAIVGLLANRATSTPFTLAEFAGMTRKKVEADAEEQSQSALPAPAAAPDRPAFPELVAGFPFGADARTLFQLCPDLVVHDPTTVACPYLRVDLGFVRNAVKFTLSAGRVVAMELTPLDRPAAARAVFEKYGRPVFLSYTEGQGWTAVESWKKGTRGGLHWSTEGGFIRLGSLDGKRLFLVFVSDMLETVQRQNF